MGQIKDRRVSSQGTRPDTRCERYISNSARQWFEPHAISADHGICTPPTNPKYLNTTKIKVFANTSPSPLHNHELEFLFSFFCIPVRDHSALAGPPPQARLVAPEGSPAPLHSRTAPLGPRRMAPSGLNDRCPPLHILPPPQGFTPVLPVHCGHTAAANPCRPPDAFPPPLPPLPTCIEGFLIRRSDIFIRFRIGRPKKYQRWSADATPPPRRLHSFPPRFPAAREWNGHNPRDRERQTSGTTGPWGRRMGPRNGISGPESRTVRVHHAPCRPQWPAMYSCIEVHETHDFTECFLCLSRF